MQRARVVEPETFMRAAALAQAHLGEHDAVLAAPRWADPLVRAAFGSVSGDLERAAPSDAERYAHVLEVAVHGAEHAALHDWPVSWTAEEGGVTLRLHDNPRYRPELDSLSKRAGTAQLEVSEITPDGEKPCPRGTAAASAGPWALPSPANRASCSGGGVGAAVIPDLDLNLRHCLLVPLGAAPVRLRFHDVAFGSSVHFTHGVHIVGERKREGADITTRVFVQAADARDQVVELPLGEARHRDGEGWTGFVIDTGKLAGQTGDLFVEVSAPSSKDRSYCFEGSAR